MAMDLIKLSGKQPGKDIEIVCTGFRPGEKLYEELITREEDVNRTKHDKIMVLKCNGQWLWNGHVDQDRFCRWLNREIEELYRVGETHDASAIKQKLKHLVPEYIPQEAGPVI